MKLGEINFILFQKFSVLKKIKFYVLDIQISCHQIPKHKTQSVNEILTVYVVSFMSKNSTRTMTRKIVPCPFKPEKN